MEPTKQLVAALDPDSAEWVGQLTGTAAERAQGETRLHRMLVQVARRELLRRQASAPWLAGAELEDLAHQCAADAMLAILRKLGTFRGESRFTTWAYRFVILEVSAKLGRHYWRTHPHDVLDQESWERLPDRFGEDPADQAASADLARAVRDAVDQTLTAHQRFVFSAIVLQAVPLDALVEQLGTNRNALYKTMFDARRKIRAHLAAKGYFEREEASAR